MIENNIMNKEKQTRGHMYLLIYLNSLVLNLCLYPVHSVRISLLQKQRQTLLSDVKLITYVCIVYTVCVLVNFLTTKALIKLYANLNGLALIFKTLVKQMPLWGHFLLLF